MHIKGLACRAWRSRLERMIKRASYTRTLMAGLATALLASCASEEPAGSSASQPPTASSAPASSSAPDAAPNGASPEQTSPPESLAIAQTAWLSVSTDGAVFVTFLDADGRYRDTRDGAVVYSGRWEQTPGGQLCFTPDNGIGGCWTYGGPGRDGVMQASGDIGRTIELKSVAYAPPTAQAQETPAPADPSPSAASTQPES